ncbi:hypothetical protein L6R50_02740 [Myxococcota bacterium]|nr:hypothetical protein [Myxococcota bacterium]
MSAPTEAGITTAIEEVIGTPLPVAAQAVLHGLHDAWHAICHQALAALAHVPHRVPRGSVPEPGEAGFVRHRGLWYGQEADWRFTLPDGRGLHIRQYRDRFDVHWDRACPLKAPVRHLVQDTPWLVASTAIALLAIPAGWTIVHRRKSR